MHNSTRVQDDEVPRNTWLLIGFGFFMFYLLWAWNYDLWESNEATAGLAIRAILENGHWFVPEIYGGLYVSTPPFYLWMGAIVSFLFQSTSALVLRLPSMLSAVLVLMLIGKWTSYYTDKYTGLLAVLLTGTSAFFGWQATRLCIYLPGTLFILTSTYFSYRLLGRTEENQDAWKGYFVFFLSGLAVITVGISGLFPLLFTIIWSLVSGKQNRLPRLPWIGGMAIFLMVLGCWLIPAYWIRGYEPVMEVVSYNSYDLLTGTAGDEEPIHYYILILLVLFLPWTPFLLAVGFSAFRNHFRAPESNFVRFNIWFGILFIAFMSLLSSKKGIFLMPVLPVMGIVSSYYIKHGVLENTKRSPGFIISALFLVILFLGGAGWLLFNGTSLLIEEVYIRPFPIPPETTVYVISGVFTISGLLILISLFFHKPRWTLGSVAGAMVLLFLSAKIVVLPTLNPRENITAEPPPETGVQNLFLTWEKQDIIHTMTINYQTQQGDHETHVYFDTRSRDGNPESYRRHRKGTNRSVPSLKRNVHHATLTNLKPDTNYYFVAGSSSTGFSEEKKFRTLPAGGKPLRIVVGGDQGTSKTFFRLSRLAARKDPHFALIGGDIAYADGKRGNTSIWNAWYRIWEKSVEKEANRMIPAILALGNHDRNSTLDRVKGLTKFDRAPFFFHYFNQGNQDGYFLKRAGELLDIIVLDSGFIQNVKTQVPWLKKQLSQNRNIRYRTALYHIPLYPAAKSYDGPIPVAQRKYWGPLFDKYELDIAFENDDHLLKRTYPLKGNKRVKQGGIPYIGGGAWGKEARTPRKDLWYIKKTLGKQHFWYVEVTPNQMRLKAYDLDGEVIDQFAVAP